MKPQGRLQKSAWYGQFSAAIFLHHAVGSDLVLKGQSLKRTMKIWLGLRGERIQVVMISYVNLLIHSFVHSDIYAII